MKIDNTLVRVIDKDIRDIKADICVSLDGPGGGKRFLSIKKYYRGRNSEEKIRRAVSSALGHAHKRKAQTVAFNSLHFLASNLPVKGVSKIMAQEVLKFLRLTKNVAIKKIIFAVKDKEIFNIYKKNVEDYLGYMMYKMRYGPYLTVDIIIERKEGIVLIERSNPPYGWALPGGFVDYGETVEGAAIREAKEETNLRLVNLRQLHTYSDPQRDPRFHTVSTVFVAKGKGEPKSGDDAQGLKIVSYRNLLKFPYSFDHVKIIQDYLTAKKPKKI